MQVKTIHRHLNQPRLNAGIRAFLFLLAQIFVYADTLDQGKPHRHNRY